jgi:hypothetical protein
MLPTYAKRAPTIRFTIRHDPVHPLKAQGQTLLNGERGFHTVTAIAITNAYAQGQAAIPTHPETEQHLFEIVTPVFTVSIGRPGRPRGLRFISIRPLEGNRRGVLMEPRGRQGVDLQRFEGNRAKHLIEIGRKQRIQDVP